MGHLRFHFSPKIRWKILGHYLLLALVLATLATYVVTRVVAGSLEERFTNQLVESARVAGDAIVRREREHLEVVRAITFTEGIEAAIVLSDTAAAQRIVLPIAANSAAEAVYVIDRTGSPIYAAHLTDAETLAYEPIADDRVVATTQLIASLALSGQSDDRGDKFAFLVIVDDDPMLVSGGPIYRGNSVVGVVATASSLRTILASVKLQSFADVTVYDSTGATMVTTFVATDDTQVEPAPTGSAAASSGGLRATQTLSGRPYQFLYIPMYVRGEAIGLLSVALPTSIVTSAGQSTRTQMASVFGVATIAVLLVGLVLARVITEPIARLVRVAQAVAAGDLSARTGIRGRDEIGELAQTFDLMTERLQKQHLGTIRALVSAVDARDPYTRGHSVRVGQLSTELGEALGLSEAQLQHLLVGGYLHDIGKIGIRDAILLKPDALTPEEREIIETHPSVGLEILDSVLLPPEVLAVVGQHHERLNGTGYPLALSAEELTLFPRIAAVADVYDALSTDRPYRAGMSIERSLSILTKEADEGLLDPEVVSVMASSATHWEQRLHDDPALKGLEPTSGLYIPSTAAPHHEHKHDAA